MNKIKNNIIWSLVNNIGISALTFFQYKIFLEEVGSHLLGVWSIIIAGVSFAKVAEAGMGSSIPKFMNEFDRKNFGYLVGTALAIHVFSSAVILLALIYATPIFIEKFINNEDVAIAKKIADIAVPCFFVNSLAIFFVSILEAFQLFKIKANIYICAQLLYIFFALFMLKDIGVIALAWAQAIQVAFVLVSSVLAVVFFVDGAIFLKMRVKIFTLKKIYRHSLNSQLSNVGVVVFEPMIKIFIGKFGDMSSVAYYDIANQMVQKVRLIIVSSAQSLIPVFAERKAKEKSLSNNLLGEALKKSIFSSAVIFLALIVSAPLFLNFISPKDWQKIYLMLLLIFPVGILSSSFSPAYFFNSVVGVMSKNTISHMVNGFLFASFCLLFGSYLSGPGVVLVASIVFCLTSCIYIHSALACSGVKIVNIAWLWAVFFVWATVVFCFIRN